MINNDDCAYVVEKAWMEPFTLKSDFARENTYAVACCASLGLITNDAGGEHFTKRWLATPKGIAFYKEQYV